MNYTATYKAPLGAGKTVYGFEVEVIDLRRGCKPEPQKFPSP